MPALYEITSGFNISFPLIGLTWWFPNYPRQESVLRGDHIFERPCFLQALVAWIGGLQVRVYKNGGANPLPHQQ